jgi:type II secretion system protein G
LVHHDVAQENSWIVRRPHRAGGQTRYRPGRIYAGRDAGGDHDLDAGRFPSTAEGLAALVRQAPGVAAWNGPYLKGSAVPTDPWNHGYLYRSPGDHSPYDIMSYGSDGQEGGSGTAADISLEKSSAKNE